MPKASERRPRTESALVRLGIEPEALEAVPNVSDLLSRCKLKREALLNCLRSSPAPVARAFLEAYKELPQGDAPRLPLEAICLKADVNPLELLGAVLMAAKSLKAQESALRAIMAHPDVVQATIDTATKGAPVLVNGKPIYDLDGSILRHSHGDHAAQRTIHEAVGFLPTKSGQSINVNLLTGQPAKPDPEQSDDDSFDTAFPTISANLEEWSDRRRQLSDGR